MRLYLDDVTDYGKSYAGNVEKCVFTFTTGPEQFDFVNNWIRGNYVNEVIRSVEEHGGKVVRVILYRDAQPTWTTNYKGEILAARPAASMSQGKAQLRFDPFSWSAIIAFALVAIIVFLLIRPVIQSVTKLLWGLKDILPPPEDWKWIAIAVVVGLVLLSGGGKGKTKKREAS